MRNPDVVKGQESLRCTSLFVVTTDAEKSEKHSWFGKEAMIEYIPFQKFILSLFAI